MAITRACVKCRRWMGPMKNGVAVLETMEDGVTPYQLWIGDLWACPECGTQIILGFAYNSVAVQHEPDFEEVVARAKASGPFYTIKGCPPGAVPYNGSGDVERTNISVIK